MNVPFTAIYFTTYESAKKLLNQADREEGLLTQLTAGGAAGDTDAVHAVSRDRTSHRLRSQRCIRDGHCRGLNKLIVDAAARQCAVAAPVKVAP